jgi:hypothetical protein
VRWEQIAEYNLITREPKKTTSKRWMALPPEQRTPVEVDALPTPEVLRMLRAAIQSKINQRHYRLTLARERRERNQLRKWISQYSGE